MDEPTSIFSNESISAFADAVQAWSLAQDHDVGIADAAGAFNVASDKIRQAVECHYWMYLDGDRIMHELM